jgi:hypothetical protein
MQDGMIRGNNRALIRVTPTLSTSEISSNDVAFVSTEIPNAVLEKGGASKLIGFHIIDYDAEGHDMNIYLSQNQQNIGSLGGDPDASDADWRASKPITAFRIDFSTGEIGQTGVLFKQFSSSANTKTSTTDSLPCVLQASSDSTSIYFTALMRETTTFSNNNDLEFVFHIEY